MRIACLQFSPQVGDVDNNLMRADAVLQKAQPENLDLLVLPEMAFSGYNFNSLEEVSVHTEPTTAVSVGYPEKAQASTWATFPAYYNSCITVSPDGDTIMNHRKSFLYFTNETRGSGGPDENLDEIIGDLKTVAMDTLKWPARSFEEWSLNPYKLQWPYNNWEFASHILHIKANLVIISMAWYTLNDKKSYSQLPEEPDFDTLEVWLRRLEPLIRGNTKDEIICVFANRTGIEGELVYAGTSAVLGIQDGYVNSYGILGRGEKKFLVADTDKPLSYIVKQESSCGQPINTVPIDTAPHDTILTDTAPSDTTPSDTTPSNIALANTALPDTAPINKVPPDTALLDTTPSNIDFICIMEASKKQNFAPPILFFGENCEEKIGGL